MKKIKHLVKLSLAIVKLSLAKILSLPLRNKNDFLLKLISFSFPRFDRECNLCGHKGKFYFFGASGSPIRNEVECPNCGSLERHRLFWLYFKNKSETIKALEPALHFAPETILELKFRKILNILDG